MSYAQLNYVNQAVIKKITVITTRRRRMQPEPGDEQSVRVKKSKPDDFIGERYVWERIVRVDHK